ncbi:MAG TPA: IclR family transcriptional regulator C-terminal domain-containing protein [Solirubrobacteraceae bacterium]
MPGDSARVLTDAPVAASSRSLSTARSVLRVFALLLEHPEGVRADEVAKTLGKSVSTAYYLLTSLCEEGFAVHETKGVYRRARGLEELTAGVGEHTHPGPALHDGLAGSVDELFLRTRKRSYLGVVKTGRIEIVAFCGRQGVPRMPGLGSEIRDSAHALAMGKVVLSLLAPSALARYVARGLTAFTPHTNISPEHLALELEQVRADGYAVDREEFDENFCCIAAPIFDARGRFVAALGASMTANVFDADRDALAPIVVDVARSAANRTATAAAAPGAGAPPAALGEPRRLARSPELASTCEKPRLLVSSTTPA